MTKKITLIGAPSSVAAHAPGQEKTPAMLRAAGLLDDMQAAGITVKDTGDLPGFRYHADPSNPRARNVAQVVENARNVADAVAQAVVNGETYLVLGGDCTNGVGAIAGASRDTTQRIGVIYLDMHGDMNTPETVDSGALDWMGVAHMLEMDGTVAEFAGFDGRAPLLQNDQIVFLGWDFEGSNSNAEREAMIRRRMNVVFLDELQADPAAAAKRALALLGPVDRLVVHFDVDVIDFAECPLGENYRHGEGATLAQATSALAHLAAHPAFSGVTIAQLNPDHGDADMATLKRFSKALATTFSEPDAT
ncbi:arginase family protein [Profundibacter amoris]|uniref:Arginase family protein n=1 Tax=Profundibacter amoris TaxID=2171755 RepID=A0A347UFQ4_9RHOB|nr:arginase family protein [Profundibacter amoris]AXX97682.1 arginase family protein [Profundibacter amoris]